MEQGFGRYPGRWNRSQLCDRLPGSGNRDSLTTCDPVDDFPTMIPQLANAHLRHGPHCITCEPVERAMASTRAEPVPVRGDYVALASGGSSGQRGVLVFDRTAMDGFLHSLSRSLLARLHAQGGPPPGGLPIAMVTAPSSPKSTTAATTVPSLLQRPSSNNYKQCELRWLGQGLRGRRYRLSDPRPAASPEPYFRAQQTQLPLEGHAGCCCKASRGGLTSRDQCWGGGSFFTRKQHRWDVVVAALP